MIGAVLPEAYKALCIADCDLDIDYSATLPPYLFFFVVARAALSISIGGLASKANAINTASDAIKDLFRFFL